MPKAAPAVTTNGPDAQLLSVLAEFDALTKVLDQIMSLPSDTDACQAVIDEIETAREALMTRICEHPVMTPEGYRARARVLARYDRGLLRPIGGGTGAVDKLVATLVRDLVGRESP